MYSKISKEWDLIAVDRFLAFESKTDSSYENILKPKIIERLINNDLSNVLDVGCGVGALTKEVANLAKRITGIDISAISIEIAKKENQLDNIEYRVLNAEYLNKSEEYSMAFSNMVLMNIPDIRLTIKSINNALITGSKFVFTITHPSFWPIYWEYYKEQKFKYIQTIEIERIFRTHNQEYEGKITRHFHRPMECYINTLTSSGFKILNLFELSDEDEGLWYPRFMLIEVEKSSPVIL